MTRAGSEEMQAGSCMLQRMTQAICKESADLQTMPHARDGPTSRQLQTASDMKIRFLSNVCPSIEEQEYRAQSL